MKFPPSLNLIFFFLLNWDEAIYVSCGALIWDFNVPSCRLCSESQLFLFFLYNLISIFLCFHLNSFVDLLSTFVVLLTEWVYLMLILRAALGFMVCILNLIRSDILLYILYKSLTVTFFHFSWLCATVMGFLYSCITGLLVIIILAIAYLKTLFHHFEGGVGIEL